MAWGGQPRLKFSPKIGDHLPAKRLEGDLGESPPERAGERSVYLVVTNVNMKQLLESGVHFGHQTRRWNPKMKPFIFGQRNGIYIIDLKKTVPLLKEAYKFVRDTAAGGGTVLFVGTKKQAQDTIEEESSRCHMPYVNQRWPGGMLTNHQTIRKSLERLFALEKLEESGELQLRVKKERGSLMKEKARLLKFLGGVREMDDLPSAVFIADCRKEKIAVAEANKLGIPVVAIVDTNCDPDLVNYVIPANDDAIRAIRLVTSKMADAVSEGKATLEKAMQESAEGADGSQAVGAREEPLSMLQAEGTTVKEQVVGAEAQPKADPAAAPSETGAKAAGETAGGTS